MEWRKLEEMGSDYEVSDAGLVRSLKGGGQKLMKLKFNQFSYVMVVLSLDGGTKHKNVHRLVAKAFIPNPENKPVVNHKNSVRHDNRAENLEWATHAENSAHAVAAGRILKGENNPKCKLSDVQVGEVRLLISEGVMTLDEIGLKYGVTGTTICAIRRGHRSVSGYVRGGLAFVPKNGRKRIAAPGKYGDDVVIKIQSLLSSGLTLTEVVKNHGFSYGLVQRIASGKRTTSRNYVAP